MRNGRAVLFMFVLLLGLSGVAVAAPLTPGRLRCEYKTDPLAVESPNPRLFWIVTGDGRGRAQSAYRVLVASDARRLARDEGDLWDSGRVASSETAHVAYAGAPLRSGQQVFWKVRVWDEKGRESGWSKAASWSMGLLRPGDWKASWIASPVQAETPDLDGASWIWHAADPATPGAGTRYFRATVNLPPNAIVREATLVVSADDRYEVAVNGARRPGPRRTDSWREAQVFDVTRDIRPGGNLVTASVTNATASPAGLVARLVVRTDTEVVTRVTDGSWESGEGANGPFAPARVVGPVGVAPWGEVSTASNKMLPAPYFRRAFTVARPVRRAVLYATALGLYELSLNGEHVGSDVLSPGWTEYRKRVHYLAYDVTKQLKPGANALGAILGDGWYAGHIGLLQQRRHYGGDPMLRLQMQVEYADGTSETLGTDGSWKTTDGPIRYADLLRGTEVDTRREMPGWDTTAFDDSAWKPAAVRPAPDILLVSQPNEPIRPTQYVAARRRTEPKPGVFIYDLGQNLTGWARLTVNGKPGQTIVLRHAERLNPDGTLYTANLRGAKPVDTFVLKGGRQTLEPRFTFHGFQYVEVTGTDAPPAPKDLVGVVVHSDVARTLRFESDHPLLNRLVENIDWGFRGNALDVPTDCPQRDERLGWTGDAQVFAKTAMLLRDTAPFFTKWLVDLCEDGQLPSGAYPDVAPSVVGAGNAAWEDAGVICTYRMYEMYGDTRVIADHWASLTRYMEHLAQVAPDGIRSPGAYGDWLLLDGPQKSAVHGTAYYYRSAQLMGEMAAALGKTDEAARYRALAARVRDAFNAKFVTEGGEVLDGGKTSQTFLALALEWDLLPEGKRAAAGRKLADMIEARGGHLATGFIGTPVLLPALAGVGREDVAHRLLLSETYPSWLFPVTLGATTMWERWDGWTPDRGFQDPGMNSFNHYWLGCVAEWMVTGVAGIDTVAPGFREIRIEPSLPNGLGRFRVVYDSLRGPIESAWTRKAGETTLKVAVPANVVATVRVPAAKGATITEGGVPAERAAGVRLLSRDGTAAVYAVGSGVYSFRVVAPPVAAARI